MGTNGNVMRFLQHHARQTPGRIMLRFDEQVYSYADVDAETERLARGLQQLGVTRGDTVGLMMPNCPEFVFTWFALARLGAITVPINVEFTEDRLARLFKVVKAGIVVADTRFTETLGTALDGVDGVHTIVRRGPGTQDEFGPIRTVDYDELQQPANGVPVELAQVGPNDPLMLMFTSGSTGEAKAVEMSHGYAEHFTTELTSHIGYRHDDVLFTCFPLFHTDAALTTIMPAVILGATAALAERFSASRFWDQIRYHEATAFTAMGAVQAILLKQPPSDQDRNHRVRVTFAGAVHDKVIEFEDRFGIRLIQLYGGTEFGLVAFQLEGRPAPGVLGRPCEHHEIIVADENDRPVPTGTVGQLLIRPRVPHACMTRYYADGDETARAWRNLWYHTGDLGKADETGLLHFVGRGKDVIRRRGRNIPPVEIESVLREHPAVHDCVAIAVPSELIEDEVKVVLEQAPGIQPDLHDILDFASRRLPRYMQPRYIEFVTDMPTTPTGKPDKPGLRKHWNTPTTVDVQNLPPSESKAGSDKDRQGSDHLTGSAAGAH